MATREENVKWINDELEKLSDEELDNVAGGSAAETADDSRFLNTLGGFCDRYGAFRIRFGDHDHEIRDAWEKVGVEAILSNGNIFSSGRANVYKINGKKVSHLEAMEHAMQVTGRRITEKDWKW